MKNFKEWRELIDKLPKDPPLCDKALWSDTRDAIKKGSDNHSYVIVARSKSSQSKIAWTIDGGFLLLLFDKNAFQSQENIAGIDELGAQMRDCKCILYKLNLGKKLKAEDVDDLSAQYDEGTTFLKIGKIDGGKALPKQQIVDLFKDELQKQLGESENLQIIFQNAQKKVEARLKGQQRQLFAAIAPLWQKLFCAFTVASSLKAHIQFYTLNILPAFIEVEWPQEK